MESISLGLFPGFRFTLRSDGSVRIFQELPDRFKWDSAPDIPAAIRRARRMELALENSIRECRLEGQESIWGSRHYKRYLQLLDECVGDS
jgi:hypothetical protein